MVCHKWNSKEVLNETATFPVQGFPLFWSRSLAEHQCYQWTRPCRKQEFREASRTIPCAGCPSTGAEKVLASMSSPRKSLFSSLLLSCFLFPLSKGPIGVPFLRSENSFLGQWTCENGSGIMGGKHIWVGIRKADIFSFNYYFICLYIFKGSYWGTSIVLHPGSRETSASGWTPQDTGGSFIKWRGTTRTPQSPKPLHPKSHLHRISKESLRSNSA